jgi:N-acetylneuraminic acid mutarotase
MSRLLRAALVISTAVVIASGTGHADPLQQGGGKSFPAKGGWQSKAAMPDAVVLSAAGQINGVFYIAGGLDANGPSATLQAYTPTTNSWTVLAPLPETLYEGNQAGVINGQFYVVGGWNGTLPTDTLYVYDPPSNGWSQKASLSHLSACGVTGVIDSKLYVTTACNGYSRPPYQNELDVYDPARDSWKVLARSIAAHNLAASAVINGRLYVAGGSNGHGVIDVTEVYDPATDAWTRLAKMPTAVVEPASVELDGKLWVFGGNDGSNTLSIVQIYDPIKNRWKAFDLALPAPTQGALAAVAYGIAFVAGGGNETTNFGTNDALFVLPSIP